MAKSFRNPTQTTNENTESSHCQYCRIGQGSGPVIFSFVLKLFVFILLLRFIVYFRSPNFNEPFDGTLLTPIMSLLGTIISFRFVIYDLPTSKGYEFWSYGLLLDPSLFRVTFYDLILCIVLLLWYSQRFEGAELYICRSQIFLKLKCQLAILQFSNKVKLRGPYISLFIKFRRW